LRGTSRASGRGPCRSDHGKHEDPPPDVPLALNRIIPVPSQVLARGICDPEAIDWLWHHWGTTWPLRHVRQTVRTSVTQCTPQAYVIEFYSGD
jgi:hypothetical protein